MLKKHIPAGTHLLKIQRPIFSTAGDDRLLIYNENCSIFFEDTNPEPRLLKLFDEGVYKVYVRLRMHRNGSFTIRDKYDAYAFIW